MPGTVKMVPQKPRLEQPKKVAAYARVSTGKDAMLHSLSSQVSYFSKLIQGHEGWLYVGVYSDEAKTGTKDGRDGFQNLLADCHAGKVNMILTKSISRFARNTVTLLETVRELKAIEVDIFFEEQNIHTMSTEGELMLTILASFAQEESRSVSENCKWRVRKSFEEGIPCNCTMLGYRYQNGSLVVVPEEACIVRQIFADYLSGMGRNAIIKKLNDIGVKTRFGGEWCKSGIDRILRNHTYTGNLLLQTTYSENHLTKRRMKNNGELPMYYVKSCHEPIVSGEDFDRTQSEIEIRASIYPRKGIIENHPFSGIIQCGGCGKNYRRKMTSGGVVWICTTFSGKGKKFCPTAKQIPEDALLTLTAKILGLRELDEAIFVDQIDSMTVPGPNQVIYRFKDGREVNSAWADHSRRDSWTVEMKHNASDRTRKRSKNLCQEQ